MRRNSVEPLSLSPGRALICLMMLGCASCAAGCAGKPRPTPQPTPPAALLVECRRTQPPAALATAPTIRGTLEAASQYIISLEADLGRCAAQVSGLRAWAAAINSTVEQDQ